jgi:hypothetical protein
MMLWVEGGVERGNVVEKGLGMDERWGEGVRTGGWEERGEKG